MKVIHRWASVVVAAALCASANVSYAAYWSVFNVEGESSLDAGIVTYASLDDMLKDVNRTGVFTPNGSGLFGRNVVDSGSDGRTYWNLFNVEGESSLDAAFVTYANLSDMLNDVNRTGLFTPNGSGLFGRNIVGSGADIVAPVPEPDTIALLLAGLMLLWACCRTQRRTAGRGA